MSALLVALVLASQPTPTVLALGAADSRGAYQAGVAYATVRTSSLSLVGVAGVSAGSLNGVLAALEHCRRPAPARSPEDSPLWEAWRSMAWERLFPGVRSCAAYAQDFGVDPRRCTGGLFEDGDALMTLAGLAELRRSLLELMGSSRDYVPSCRVPIALSVAAETPAHFRIGEQAIETSRRLVMMELRTVGTPATLAVCAIRTSTAVRGGTVVIELPQLSAPDVGRAAQVVTELERLRGAARVLAAQEPGRAPERDRRMRTVLERLERDLPPGATGLEARIATLRAGWDEVPVEVVVLDGATLDRVLDGLMADVDATCRRIDPMRLVDLLSVSSAPVVMQESRRVTHCGTDCAAVRHGGEWCPLGTQLCEDRLFDGAILDPQPIAAAVELRLPPPLTISVLQLAASRADPPPQGAVGLAFYKPLVLGLVDVAQSYEIQTLSRYGQLDGVRLVRQVRSGTITGDLLYGEGAFVDQRFRRFDFHQGIVDTVLHHTRDCGERRALAARLGVRAVPELWALWMARTRRECPPTPEEETAMAMVPAASRTAERFLGALDGLPRGSSELRFTEFVDALRESAPEGEPERHPAITHFRHWWIDQLRQGFARLGVWEPADDRPLIAAEGLIALSERAVDGWVYGSRRVPSDGLGAVLLETLVPRSASLLALGEQGFGLRWVWLSWGGFVSRDNALALELGAQSFVRRDLDSADVAYFGPSLGLAFQIDDLCGGRDGSARTDSVVVELCPTEVGARGLWLPSLRGTGLDHFGWEAYLQLLDGYVEVTLSSDEGPPDRVSVGLAQVDALLYWLARLAWGG